MAATGTVSKTGGAAAAKSATRATKAVTTGIKGKKTKNEKMRLTPRFRRPRTKIHPKNPKFPTNQIVPLPKMDDWRVIKSALSTGKATRLLEQNTLTFLCDTSANKYRIKLAVERRFGVKVARVNTLIRPDGVKKAYVKLNAQQDVTDIATKLGVL